MATIYAHTMHGNVPMWNRIAHTAKHVKRSHGTLFGTRDIDLRTRVIFLVAQKKAIDRYEQIARRIADQYHFDYEFKSLTHSAI